MKIVTSVSLLALYALLSAPAAAQSYAPAPRLAPPAQQAPSDACAPVPQGQGSASDACKRECSRNPQYSPLCAKAPAATAGAAPNWGAAMPAAGAPVAATPVAPASAAGPAAGAPASRLSGSQTPAAPSPSSGQFADGSVKPSIVGNANAGAFKVQRPQTGAVPVAGTAPKAPQTASMGAGTSGNAPTLPASGPVAGGGTASPAAGDAAVAARGPTMAVAPALAPQSSSTLPGSQPPPRNLGANAVAAIGCGPYLAQGGEPRFDSVDGQPRGVVFAPGKTYTLKGCGFGDRKGSVALNGSSGGLANLVLLVQKWSEDTIAVLVDPKVAGVADQQSIEVVVLRGDGRRLQQSGHAFEAARESIKLASLPPGVLTREGPNLVRPAPKTTSPAPSGATLLVETAPYSPKGQFCPSEPNRDVLNLTRSKLGLRNDFIVERIDVRDLTNKDWAKGDHGENGSYEWHRQNALSSELSGQYAVVVPSWMGLYRKRDALREMLGVMTLGASSAVAMAINENQPPGSSLCWSSYELEVRVRGPRGLSPF